MIVAFTEGIGSGGHVRNWVKLIGDPVYLHYLIDSFSKELVAYPWTTISVCHDLVLKASFFTEGICNIKSSDSGQCSTKTNTCDQNFRLGMRLDELSQLKPTILDKVLVAMIKAFMNFASSVFTLMFTVVNLEKV